MRMTRRRLPPRSPYAPYVRSSIMAGRCDGYYRRKTGFVLACCAFLGCGESCGFIFTVHWSDTRLVLT